MSHDTTNNAKDRDANGNMIGIFDPNGLYPNPLTGLPYSQDYLQLAEAWSQFPAYSHGQEIIESIRSDAITFVVSGTGSGKTVLVPKFALHYLGYDGKIAIVLPKRTIAHSAAEFAAKTLDVELGGEVGYVYKGSPPIMSGPKNKLVYMTDGVLINKFVQDPLLSEFSMVIMDEAHERKVQTDLILLFIKKLIESTERLEFRAVIMSATIDTDKYQDYFEPISSNVIQIQTEPNYPISTYFLEEPTKNFINTGFDLIMKLVNEGMKDDLLFFITTSQEAIQLCDKVRDFLSGIFCIEVFADMPADQKIFATSANAFLDLGDFNQKLVMATNVAESSITIDGLKVVIDSGYELSVTFDATSGASVIEKKLITKAQALQRRGRVGRLSPGICYSLLTEKQFDDLEDYPEPKIMTENLTMELLKITLITPNQLLSEGIEYINDLLDKPPKENINYSLNLFDIYNLFDNDKVTGIVRELNQFSSLDLSMGLFLIYSFQFKCAREATQIVAMIQTFRGSLARVFREETKENSQLRKKVINKKSDHFTLLNLYTLYDRIKDKIQWCRKYEIHYNKMKKTQQLARQLYSQLIRSLAPKLARTKMLDLKGKIKQALQLSHLHLVMNTKKLKSNMRASPNSVVSLKKLKNKRFIYEELVEINDKYEFNVITII